jgi:hypothetical protein
MVFHHSAFIVTERFLNVKRILLGDMKNGERVRVGIVILNGAEAK